MADVKKARAQAKACLTRCTSNIAKLLVEVESGVDLTVEKCEFALGDFENKLKLYDEKQSLYELELEDEEMLAEVEAGDDYRTKQTEVMVKLKECLNSIKVKKSSSTASVSDVDTNSSSSNSAPRNPVHLPKLQLPHFNGTVIDFQGFWDKFVALIDNRDDLCPVNKFTYLQSLLRGEARSCLQGLALTEANYSTAKEILLKRFGKRDKVIVAHIQALLNIPAGETLWKIHDQVQVHVRSLANLGVTGENYGLVLTPMILHRLPPPVRLEWARTGEGKEGDVEHLLDFLYQEIQRRERSTQMDSRDPTSSATGASGQPNRPRRPTGSALISPESHRKCDFCQQNHFSDRCPSIINLDHEQRKQKVMGMGLCFKCLSKTHRASQCKRKCFHCKGSHHSVLHKRTTAESSEGNSSSHPGGGSSNASHRFVNPNTSSPDSSHIASSTSTSYYSQSSTTGRATLMQVVKTVVCGKLLTVFFDSGSDFSYITDDTAKRLGLQKSGETKGAISLFGGNFVERDHNVFHLQLGGINTTLLSLKTISSPLLRAAVPPNVLEQFQDIPMIEDLSQEKSLTMDILIGLDFYHELMCPERVIKNGLVAQRTGLGWMLSGSYPLTRQGVVGMASCNVQTSLFANSLCPSEATVRKFWELDSIGILGEGTKGQEEESQVLGKFNQGVSFNGERYQVELPWKGGSLKEQLLNNECSAQHRLVALDKKLSGDPDLHSKYREVFVDLENSGIIEEVSSTDAVTHPVFYLPHRPVLRDDSRTTKIRPVFDASAKGKNGVSLNDCLEIGPKMTPDLIQILLRFRRWKYGLSADIRKAFLQIELGEKDRDVHRFLLFDINKQVRHMRFRRVTFGNASSPFMLNAVIKLHLAKFEEDNTVKELLTNLYVDDWLTGSDSEEELMHMMGKATQILKQGGFPLSKWTSNSPKVRSEILQIDDYCSESQSHKILGLTWHPESDCFHFETAPPPDVVYTKRLLLGLIARQFDPLGLLTPFTVSLKILFQDVWRAGFEWDELLPAHFQDAINHWTTGLELLRHWEVPRRVTTLNWQTLSKVELIVFVDASEKAYGTCIYLAGTDDSGNRTRRLVTAKVRVAPLKKVTLPRLELLAAVLGARLLTFVRQALELPDDTPYSCWTDSKITQAWIQGNTCRWKQFVRNRVEEIQSLTNPSSWKHCPGTQNPADLLTRGIEAKILMESTLWLNGPERLVAQTDAIPVDSNFEEPVEAEKESSGPACAVAVETETLVNYERFSSFGKLLRVIALVLRFVKKLKATRISIQQDTPEEELIHAKRVILKDLQKRHYHTELEDLLKHGQVSRHSSLLQLSPFLDTDGLIRVKGRLDQATGLTYDERHPVILPRCHVSHLLVRSQHALLKHAGVGTLMSSLRCQYWIVAVRGIAKKVVSQCVRCRRYDSRPLDQVTAPLPKDRVTQAPPFSVTGIDCAGPLYCNDTGEKKFYIVLFTCAVTRALHLELTASLSLDDFILAFRRFVSRRALPSIIYSDNARTFKAASALLQVRFGKEIVCWKNICPLSPNWGGWWERLVRSVKSALKKSLGKQSVSKTELETLLTEVEACVNSRPLLYISEKGNVLTPSHFLIGRGTPMTSAELEKLELTVNLSSKLEFEESMTEHFWRVWRDEYLRNLPPATGRGSKTDAGLNIDSLVMIRDEKKPRMLWALGSCKG